MYGRKLSVAHLHVPGCRCWYKVNKDQSGNLSSRGREAVMIGYCGGSRGYRLWDSDEGKVVRSRHVQFDENTASVHSNDDHDAEPDAEMTNSPEEFDADMPDVQVDSQPMKPPVESPTEPFPSSTQDPDKTLYHQAIIQIDSTAGRW